MPSQSASPRRRSLRQLGEGWWVPAALVVIVVLGAVGGRIAGSAAGGARAGSVDPWSTSNVLASVPVVTDPVPLAWSPPALTDPETVVVDAGHHTFRLDAARDYRVILPTSTATVLVGGVTLVGGRNVVIVGGVIAVPPMSRYPDRSADHPTDLSGARRGLYLKGQTGTVHIEGVHFTGDLSDAINLDQRKGAVVQLENLRVDLVRGGRDLHHADVIQTWAGPRILRVDGLLAATEYQGLFLLPTQRFKQGPVPESFSFRRTVVTMLPGSGYAMWLPHRWSWLDCSGLTLRLVQGREPRKLTWPADGPADGADGKLGVRVVPDTVPVQLPAGNPGGGYVTPGYVGDR